MALDRDGTLKKAEKLLRQGRLEPAIEEYLRVVEEYPRDWSTANTLGELYVRAGKPDQAVSQYSRIAEHFVAEGFYPKAAALLKKILKLLPQDEPTQLRLSEISTRQGLLGDAKMYLNAIAARRRARGDRRGTAEIVVRLGTIDPADFDARFEAARTVEEMGEEADAGARYQSLYTDLLEKGRVDDAIGALKQFVRLNPLDHPARSVVARAALERGDLEGARAFLDENSAENDPALLLSLAEIELRSGEIDRARNVMSRLLAAEPSRRQAILDLGWSLAGTTPDGTFACVDTVVDASIAASDFAAAAALLQDFVKRTPGQIPALLKLVEVCVDGGLESAMYEAQEQLTDAYLAANQAAEARVIAEDLVAREPWEPAHIERFRKALVMLRVSDPDTVIAERLSGQAPFMAHDPFFDGITAAEPVVPPAPVVPDALEDAAFWEVPPEPFAVPLAIPVAAPVPVAPPIAPPVAPPPAAPPAAPAALHGNDEIDLTGALGDLDDLPMDDLAPPTPAVAATSEEKADADVSSQHMTLARTYIEIGMVEEAMSSLQTAARSPRHRFEAAAAMGRLSETQGDVAGAIEWLERAAESPAPSRDEGRTVLYDLGVLLDRVGEISRALAVFLELQSDVGDYRDVPARIDRLSRVQTGG